MIMQKYKYYIATRFQTLELIMIDVEAKHIVHLCFDHTTKKLFDVDIQTGLFEINAKTYDSCKEVTVNKVKKKYKKLTNKNPAHMWMRRG